MGEHISVRVLRALGIATLVVASSTVLSSCSQPDVVPGGAASSQAGDPIDPSVPTATPTETIASDTPAPVVTPVASAGPSAAPTASTDARASVVPAITTKDWDAAAKALDVSAIVPGIVESGGSCTATVTSGATARTATSTGVGAGSYTGCPAVSFTGLTPGSWTVVVRYTSERSAGSSAAATVQIG